MIDESKNSIKEYSFKGLQEKGFGLEIVHKCNARCSFCCLGYTKNQQVTDIFTRKTWKKENKLMDFKFIEALVKRHDPATFVLTGQTEPFLDKRIPNILSLTRNKCTKFNLAIFSNANLMTEEIMDIIIRDPQFNSINFSLNALTDETRKNIMGIPYQPAEDNILKFLEKRRDYGREIKFNEISQDTDELQDLRVGITFILTHGTYNNKLVSNINEIDAFKYYWDEILREYHCNYQVGIFPSGNWAGGVPMEALYQRLEQPVPQGCGQWECCAPALDVDGNIMICCYNYSLSFGSALDDIAMGKWHSRKEIFNVNYDKVYASPYCDKCSFRHVPYPPEYYNLCKR